MGIAPKLGSPPPVRGTGAPASLITDTAHMAELRRGQAFAQFRRICAAY
jgi:hypothetical protein